MRSLLTCLSLCLALAACQSAPTSPQPAPPDTRIQEILERGSLRVGVSADLPPLAMRDRQGKIVGFEIDIVQALANAMGLELSLEVRPFPELLPALERGETDMVIAGLTMTPERNARVAFAGPYFVSGMSLLTRNREIAEVQEIGALDVAGRRYLVLASSTSEGFARELLPQTQIITTPDYESAVQMLIDGQADAMLAEHLICSLEAWRRPDAGLIAMETPFTVEPLGIALPPDAPLLLNLVENYLDTLDHTGLLAGFKAKWLADGRWMEQLP
jgi:polar amino acid transport system substrate-binding protein